MVPLSKNVIFIPEEAIQYGNILGNSALFISLTPTFLVGTNDFHLFFGSGFGWLILSNNQNKYGGLGITSVFGFDLTFFNKFGVNANYGYEGYGKITYNTIGVGVKYLLND